VARGVGVSGGLCVSRSPGAWTGRGATGRFAQGSGHGSSPEVSALLTLLLRSGGVPVADRAVVVILAVCLILAGCLVLSAVLVLA
jgi:hypothetical protein